MSNSPKFNVREADNTARDGEFIIAAFDSALPYLASIGSHEQWGLTPFSERDGWVAETMQQIQDAETYRLTGKGDAVRIFIVEAEVPAEHGGDNRGPGVGFPKSADGCHEQHSRTIPGQSKCVLPIGFAFVREDHVPEYILRQEHLKIEDTEQQSCAYIEVMVADQRVDSVIRKGSGGALIQGIKEFGREAGKKRLFIDGWAGNGKKLMECVACLFFTRRTFTVKFSRRRMSRTKCAMLAITHNKASK